MISFHQCADRLSFGGLCLSIAQCVFDVGFQMTCFQQDLDISALTVADNIEIVVFRKRLECFCDARIERAGFFKKQFVLIFKA